MENLKYQTVEEVFNSNYEALKPWRLLMCVPNRLPDVVRYFISQRLGGREVIRVTLDYEPQNLDNQVLEFRDGSYLVPPDELFEDKESYLGGLLMRELRAELYVLDHRIGLLRNDPHACRVLKRSSAILRALHQLDCFGDDMAEMSAAFLAAKLRSDLKESFWKGRFHAKSPKNLLSAVKKGEEFLARWPEATDCKLRIAMTSWLAHEMEQLSLRFCVGRRKSKQLR